MNTNTNENTKKDNKLASVFKSFKNKLKPRRGSSVSSSDFNRIDPGDPYLYITNFEQITEEECLSADRKNESIYHDELETYKEVSSLMDRRNASFMKPSAPKPPPKPSNIEKLYEYRRKYVKTQALEQTEAVIFLHTIGKIYVREKTGNPNEFEAYEAISMANEIKEKCPGDKMFQDRRDNYLWNEKSEKMTDELKKRRSRSNFRSVYDLEPDEIPQYQERIRSMSNSSVNNSSVNNLSVNVCSGSTSTSTSTSTSSNQNHKGLYPVLPSAPPCSVVQ
jgi:hypothetical protein